MKTVYRYAIIRFRPFAETEEFANIGVIAIDLSHHMIDYRIAPKRFARVRHFFDEQGYAAYAGAIDVLRLELGRISDFLPSFVEWNAEATFQDIIARRESSIRFSEARIAQSDADLSAFLDSLYARFVRRDFSADTPEVELTRDIRHALRQRHLGFFKSLKVEDELMSIPFPLAHRGNRLRAIRPLAFGQKSPMAMVDYAAHWRKRLDYLLTRQRIMPHDVLIATQGPGVDAEPVAHHAYQLASEELAKLPFDIVPGEGPDGVNDAIIAFAHASVGRTPLGT